MRKLRISLGLHNLSGQKHEIRRTGIQEVVFRILQEALRFESEEVELLPILRLPHKNFAQTPFFFSTHFNASDFVLDATLREIGVSQVELIRRWPYLKELFRPDYSAERYEASCMKAIAQTDIFFEVSLSDIRHVMDALHQTHPKMLAGLCIHDLGPMKYPEYVDQGMDTWFRMAFMECVRSVDFTISVSRHTALDLEQYQALRGSARPQSFYAALPSPAFKPSGIKANAAFFQKHPDVKPGQYICSVATLEPRKNLLYLIRGFRRFRRLFPQQADKVQLVLIGHAGWKNQALLELINKDPEGIIMAGFIPQEDLEVAFENALCLVMPSHYEGFGLPIAHARSKGIPVITCFNSSLPEASALEAHYVRPWLEDDLACAIAEHLRSDFRPSQLDSGYRPTGSWKELLSSWIDCFQKMAKGNLDSNRESIVSTKRGGAYLLDVSRHSLLRKSVAEGESTLAPRRGWQLLPWLSSEEDALQYQPDRMSELLLDQWQVQDDLFHQCAAGSETAQRLVLDSSSWLVLSTVCRLEAIEPLISFLHRGGSICALLTDKDLQSKKFPAFAKGLQRWASLIVCDSAELCERLKSKFPDLGIQHSNTVFQAIEQRDFGQTMSHIEAIIHQGNVRNEKNSAESIPTYAAPVQGESLQNPRYTSSDAKQREIHQERAEC